MADPTPPDLTPDATTGLPNGVGAKKSYAYWKFDNFDGSANAEDWHKVKLVAAAYQDIASTLGLVFTDSPSAEQEGGRHEGTPRKAVRSGLLVPLVITYQINNETQQATVYCTPQKAATADALLRTKKYWNTFNIVSAHFKT